MKAIHDIIHGRSRKIPCDDLVSKVVEEVNAHKSGHLMLGPSVKVRLNVHGVKAQNGSEFPFLVMHNDKKGYDHGYGSGIRSLMEIRMGFPMRLEGLFHDEHGPYWMFIDDSVNPHDGEMSCWE